MSSRSTVITEMLLLLFRLLSIPLSMFSLAKAILTSLFSNSTLLAGRTKTVVLVDAILGEEKSYPKPVQLEVDF